MTIHHEIEQGTEEWHRLKWAKVGGSTSKQLFTDSQTLLVKIVSELTEPFELADSPTTAAMERGTEMEPQARKELEKYIGVEMTVPGWVQSSWSEIVGISPDGLSSDNKIAIEIKCPSKEQHTKCLIDDIIPDKNVHQCIHYFSVIDGLETLYFCSFRPESIKPLFVKKITPDTMIKIGTIERPVKAWAAVAKVNAYKLASDAKKIIENLNSI